VNVALETTPDLADGRPRPGRTGNRGPLGAPQGVYLCAEGSGWIALSVMDDRQWEAACEVLAVAGSVVPDDAARREQATDLDWAVGTACGNVHRDVLVAQLQAAGVPAAAVVAAEDVLGNPQLAARGYFEQVEHPVAGPVRMPGPGVRWHRRSGPMHAGPAPTLGQHNAEVLGGLLGLSDEQLASLAEQDIIGTRPVQAR
jgi:crotonobetainyl-CoA:carnitine CoA-transferase CaiB-like acyl-CoA transferase